MDLTKSDLVNFLIREHAPELAAKEIKSVRSLHYDPVRHLNWITPRLKEAFAKSDMAQVAILQDEIRSIEISVISRAANQTTFDDIKAEKSPRKKRKPKNTIEEIDPAQSDILVR